MTRKPRPLVPSLAARFVLTLGLLAAPGLFAQTPTPNGAEPGDAPGGVPGGPAEWNFVSVISSGCDSFATGFNVAYVNVTSPMYQDTIVESGGLIYMDEYLQQSPPSDTTWFFYDANNRGYQTATFPIPPGQPVRYSLTLHDAGQAPVWRTVVTVDGCDTFNITSVESGPVSSLQTVPTLGGAGLVALVLLLGAAGFLVLRRAA